MAGQFQLQTVRAQAVSGMFGVKAKVVTLKPGDHRYDIARAWGDNRWVEVGEPTEDGLYLEQAPTRGFWKELRSLHFALGRGRTGEIEQFYRRYGAFRPDLICSRPGIFGPPQGGDGRWPGGEPLGYVRAALSWFNSLVAIYENARNGRPGYLGDRLAEAGCWGRKLEEDTSLTALRSRPDFPHLLNEAGYGRRKPPFPITFGSCPEFLFRVNAAYRPKEGIWVTPETDDELITASYDLVFNTVIERLSGLKLAGVHYVPGKRGFEHAFAFQADNLLDFALLQWYLEELAGLNLSLCRCGQLIPADRAARRAKWCSERCRQRYKKQAQRDTKKSNREDQAIRYGPRRHGWTPPAG